MTRFQNRNFYWYLPSIVLTLIFTIYIFFFLSSTPVKDERFFFNFAQQFSQYNLSMTLESLKSFTSPIAPLSFLGGGFLLRICNSIFFLRMCNVIIFFIFSILYVKTILSFTKVSVIDRLLVLFLFLLNPYIFLITPHFYTDSLYLLFVVLLLYFTRFPSPRINWLIYFFLPISRQIGVLYPVGKCLTLLDPRNIKKSLKGVLVWGASLFGIIILVYSWKGLSPSPDFNERNAMVKQLHGLFRLEYVAYYLSCIGFYLFPILLKLILKTKKSMFFYMFCTIGPIFIFIFQPSVNVFHKIDNLGLLHMLVKLIFSSQFYLIPLAFMAGVASGSFFILFKSQFVPLIFKNWIVLFFIIQSVNQIGWDKYILELIPLIGIAYLFNNDSTSSSH